MNRGVFIIGLAGIVMAVANVFASGIFAVLFCFDSCPPVLSNYSSPLAALLPLVILAPTLALILVAWIWELRTLRRLEARGALIFAALFPLIALAAIAGLTALTAASEGAAPVNFTPLQLSTGEFAIVIWPLLVSIVAFIYRQRAVA
ncbi:MAG TPA: hypothetical protein VF812_11200 [Ktedonobacterales bacterium]